MLTFGKLDPEYNTSWLFEVHSHHEKEINLVQQFQEEMSACYIKAWFFSKILSPTSGHHSENNGQELFFLAWVIYKGLKSPEMPPFKYISPSVHPFCYIHSLVYQLLTCQQCPAQLASIHFLEKAQPNSLMKHKSLFASPSPLSKIPLTLLAHLVRNKHVFWPLFFFCQCFCCWAGGPSIGNFTNPDYRGTESEERAFEKP